MVKPFVDPKYASVMLKKIKGLSVTWFSPGSPVFSTTKLTATI
jgi:hypothetical protein